MDASDEPQVCRPLPMSKPRRLDSILDLPTFALKVALRFDGILKCLHIFLEDESEIE
jgi:hypothetical protein